MIIKKITRFFNDLFSIEKNNGYNTNIFRMLPTEKFDINFKTKIELPKYLDITSADVLHIPINILTVSLEKKLPDHVNIGSFLFFPRSVDSSSESTVYYLILNS